MCTVEKRGNVFILTLIGDDEHRLNPTLIATIRSAISDIKSQSTTSVAAALVTTATGKFFSNGFDLRWAQSGVTSTFLHRLRHMVEIFKPVVADLLSLPMPTIAAVSGHAAGAGFALALSHDYILMRKDKGVLYMSELDMGMTFPEYFSVLLREKVRSPAAKREVMLKAAKLKAEEAARLEIVDSAHDGAEEVVSAAVRLGEKLSGKKWNGEVYGEIRKAIFPQLCTELGLSAARSIVTPPNAKL